MANKPKILIIDDSKNECFLIKEYLSPLSSERYEVQLAYSPDEAKSLMQKEKFDCIIMDHLMGIDTGVEFIRDLKMTEHRNIPVILMSGYEDPEIAQQAKEAGAALFLAKRDLTEEHINAVVAELLGCAA